MAIYEPKRATLNGIKGAGFIFSKKTYAGKEYQGVFFAEEDPGGDLEHVIEDEEASFRGVVYERNKERFESFTVNVYNVVKVHAGARADFQVVEKA